MTATIDSPAPHTTIAQGDSLQASGHADPDSTVYFTVTFLKNTIETHSIRADRKGLWGVTTKGFQSGTYVAHAVQLPQGHEGTRPDVLSVGAYVEFSVKPA
ncbi:hypothetical protein BOSP111201_00620 [Bordetella sputigena]|uniref:hypothetical protein n=1 Tax=Bordetella sputigena TaxID=1416810 RepID=UPI0039EF41ED